MLLALLYALLRLLIDLLILRGRPTADRDLELLVLRQQLLAHLASLPAGSWQSNPGLRLLHGGHRLSPIVALRETVPGINELGSPQASSALGGRVAQAHALILSVDHIRRGSRIHAPDAVIRVPPEGVRAPGRMVGRGGLEPPTSALSARRSAS